MFPFFNIFKPQKYFYVKLCNINMLVFSEYNVYHVHRLSLAYKHANIY